MPLLPGTDNLLVRFSFLDWENEEPGSISIARVGGDDSRPLEITPAIAAAMLDDAASTIELQAQFYVDGRACSTALGPNFFATWRKASRAPTSSSGSSSATTT
jgi:hypothetical protein